MTTIAELDRRYYPELVDEHVRFDGMIRRHLRPDAVVLDAGAGRGLRFPHDYEDSVARMAGVDRDPAVRENPNLTDAAVADLVDLPYGDAEFDVVFSKFVFEHLDRPITVMRELHRVLKPGGHLLIHTPNRWHYVTLAAALTPTRVHIWYRTKLGWDEADTFPTRYRANDAKTMEAFAAVSGFLGRLARAPRDEADLPRAAPVRLPRGHRVRTSGGSVRLVGPIPGEPAGGPGGGGAPSTGLYREAMISSGMSKLA